MEDGLEGQKADELEFRTPGLNINSPIYDDYLEDAFIWVWLKMADDQVRESAL